MLLAGIAVSAALVGLTSGDAPLAAATALGLYAARQAWIARQLARMLRDRQRLEPPYPGGVWREVFSSVRDLQLRSRKRKRRLSRFVSRFQEAATALPDAVVILGRDNRVEWRNPAAGALLGLAGRDCVGSPIENCIRDPALAGYLAREDHSRALVMPAPGNRSVVLSILMTPFGRRRQHILIARDITRSYHMDTAQKDFVANVSHEIRTPLTILSGSLEMFAETGIEDPASQAAIESMRRSVERMRHLVTDLLTLSRLEMSTTQGGEEPVDVPEVLHSIVADARLLASASRHTVHLDCDPELWLRGRATELRSAFSNLVYNAVRHTPPRSRIEVRWQQHEECAHLRVTDNGPGIAPRHISRLTERFYRVDGSRSAHTGGTGLGLSIVKHVLERHGATLGVTSREGAGTTFECRFPVIRTCLRGQQDAQPHAQPRETREPEQTSQSGS